MSIRATINQKQTESIYRGEDKTFRVYLYESATYEPVDLTGLTITACLVNVDDTKLTINTTAVNLAGGIFNIPITSAESALLKLGTQMFQLNFDDTGVVDIEILNNGLQVIEPIC